MQTKDLVKICRCPVCNSNFVINDGSATILCDNKHQFPLVNGRIPILLVDQQVKTEELSDLETSKSFSKQWEMFEAGDQLWGWNEEEAKRLFMISHGFKAEEIKDKLILDLGCGHGVYTRYFAELGADVVGFDISNSFLAAEKRLHDTYKDHVNFLQGDVTRFSLKEEIFDFVWCSGVLHHTPSTKVSFDNVRNVVKKGGRFYLWLYKPVFYTPLLILIRKLTTKLPEGVLVPLCYIGAPFFALTKAVLNLTKTGYRDFEKRSLRENALSIHDTLAPPYRWHHHKEEAVAWFEEAGFKDIIISEESSLGFGLYGTKK